MVVSNYNSYVLDFSELPDGIEGDVIIVQESSNDEMRMEKSEAVLKGKDIELKKRLTGDGQDI